MGAMRRWFGVVVGASAGLVLIGSDAQAQVQWNVVCSTAGLGIATFPTCASAQLSLVNAGTNLYELRFWNNAGEPGTNTFANATVTAIGFGGTAATASNLQAFRVNGSAYAGWQVENDIPGPSGANGFRVTGVNNGVVSEQWSGGNLQDREMTNWTGSFATGFVRYSFNTSSALNLQGLTLDLHVQNGPNGQSTGYSCPPSASPTAGCSPGGGGTGNVVPEPSTYVLLGSGLLGILGIAARRRRQG